MYWKEVECMTIWHSQLLRTKRSQKGRRADGLGSLCLTDRSTPFPASARFSLLRRAFVVLYILKHILILCQNDRHWRVEPQITGEFGSSNYRRSHPTEEWWDQNDTVKGMLNFRLWRWQHQSLSQMGPGLTRMSCRCGPCTTKTCRDSTIQSMARQTVNSGHTCLGYFPKSGGRTGKKYVWTFRLCLKKPCM